MIIAGDLNECGVRDLLGPCPCVADVVGAIPDRMGDQRRSHYVGRCALEVQPDNGGGLLHHFVSRQGDTLELQPPPLEPWIFRNRRRRGRQHSRIRPVGADEDLDGTIDD